MRAVVVTSLIALGCHPAVHRAYETRLHAALAGPGAPASGWAPTGVVALSDELVADALQATWRGARVAGTPITPGHDARAHLDVVDLMLDLPAEPCSGCTGLRARLVGEVDVDGAPLGVDVALDADLALTARDVGGPVDVRVAADRVLQAELAWDGVPPDDVLRDDPVGAWLARRLLDGVPPAPLGRLGRPAMPIRDARLDRGRGGPVVALRFAIPEGTPVAPVRAPAEGWTARVGVDTVHALARRALLVDAPRRGPRLELTALDLDDDRYRAALRAWHPAAGWFTDLEVSGPIDVSGGLVALVAREVRELGGSTGAKRVDPVALVRDADVLSVLARAIGVVVPRAVTGDVPGAGSSWRVTSLRVDGGIVTVRGTASFGDDEPEG